MLNHNSAQLRDGTPHSNSITNKPISEALKRRAQSLINDRAIDKGVRAFIEHTLETGDPYLRKLVRRVNAGESILMVPPPSKRKSTTKKKRTKDQTKTVAD